MSDATAVLALVELGFTRVEAEAYVYLLQHGAQTGYAVAQGLGKAAAGAYKVLDALAARGAVEVGEDGARRYRPVPYEELLERMARSFSERRDRARAALVDLRPAEGDDRIWQLDDYGAVLARLRDMLGRAQRSALADLFPAMVDLLRPDLEATAARGVQVIVQAYREAAVEGARVVVARGDGERMQELWRAAWANLVIDGGEHLLSYVDPERNKVLQAMWSRSAYLGLLYTSGLACEMRARAAEWALDHPRDAAARRESDSLRTALDHHPAPALARALHGSKEE